MVQILIIRDIKQSNQAAYDTYLKNCPSLSKQLIFMSHSDSIFVEYLGKIPRVKGHTLRLIKANTLQSVGLKTPNQFLLM